MGRCSEYFSQRSQALQWYFLLISSPFNGKIRNKNKLYKGFTAQQIGHWTLKNMRLWLEAFAKSRKLDPLLPETWYDIPFEDVASSKVLVLSFSISLSVSLSVTLYVLYLPPTSKITELKREEKLFCKNIKDISWLCVLCFLNLI